MAARVCGECTTVYAVGLPGCPQCGAADVAARFDWEEDMPKATAAGATNGTGPADSEPDTAAAEPAQAETAPEPVKAAAAASAPPPPPAEETPGE